MLKTRIIPCLDVKDGRVVKGVNFVDARISIAGAKMPKGNSSIHNLEIVR